MTQASETRPVGNEVNAAQREAWATEGGQRYQGWQNNADRWEALARPYGTAMLDTAGLQPGERVLDVGCGFGATTVEAAGQVAPGGTVVGVDISALMLERARQRVASLGNVTLLEADAQVHAFEADSFDAIVSRFGMMFFDDPLAAFVNLRRALRPAGRLVFVCNQDPVKTEWTAVALAAAVQLVGRTPDLGEPGVPGPFAFADGDRLCALVTDAGFRGVTLETLTRPERIADDADGAATFIMSLPETRQLLDGATDSLLAEVRAALSTAFAPYAGPHGVVTDGAAWLVSARR